MTSEQLDDVLSELRKIVRLLSILVTKDLSQREQIALLASAGFQPKEIAELIGTTPNTVSVTLHSVRKRAKSAKPKASKGSAP